jgi:hypothetical protein
MMQVTWWGYYDCPDCGGSISNVQCPTCLARAKTERENILTYTYTDTTPKWISVKDKLPTEGQRVIYYFKMVGVHVGRYKSLTDEDGVHQVFYSNAGWLTDDVTHWMPLPELPL